MNIMFKNGKSFEYIDAYTIEKDNYKGETRESIEIYLPIAQTDFESINSIINNPEIINSFTLIGETPIYEDGSIGLPDIYDYEGYIYGDRILIEDGILKFKKYKASQAELENEELKTIVDQLLIAMEV